MSDTVQPGELAPGTRVGQYTITRRLGAGGMGAVYEGVHSTLNKPVAIKVLHHQFAEDEIVVARFVREGQAASRIRHPHSVDVTDVGVIDGIPCLVMEYLEGESLRALYQREAPLAITTLIDLMLPVIAAVDAAHRSGVVHRDLKPPNVFLARVGGEVRPKVLDFGISKLVDQTATSDLTADSTFLGSPHYAAPEAARGQSNVDARADQYALGVMLYEGLTAKRPFDGMAENFMALLMAISQGGFPPPRHHRPDLPAELEAVILRAMALDKENRFPATSALGAALMPFASARARAIWAHLFAAPSAYEPTALDVSVAPTASGVAGDGTLTMGSVAGSIAASGGTKPWVWAVAGGVAVALSVALIVASVSLLRSSPSEAPAASAPSVPYTVELKVEPKTATIELDGEVVGVGSLSRSLPPGSKSHTLRITADGYETMNLMFSQESLPPKTLALRAVPKSAAPTSSAAPVKGRDKPAPAVLRPAPKGGGVTTDNKDPWAN